MWIQASILGSNADPNQWDPFTCVKHNGEFNFAKYAETARALANLGANCTRELPFLVTDGNYTGTVKQRNFLPFVWNSSLGVYNLDVLNQRYFDNLKEMIKITNRHNMAFQFSMFDRCHGANMPDSPWNLNQQRLEGYYDWNDYTRRYVLKVVETANQAKLEMLEQENIHCRVLFELENEPMDERFVKTAIETLKLLLANGVKKEEIEDGVSYLPYENGKPVIRLDKRGNLIRSRLFEKLKKAKKDAGLYPGEDKLDKTRYFSTIHQVGVNPAVLREMKVALRHTRRLSLSCDGEKPKPNADTWFYRLVPLFSSAKWRPGQVERLERYKIEHVYRGDMEGNSPFGDALDGILGISRAIYQVFGRWPENYGKFPKVIEGPKPVIVPIPVEPPTLQQQIDELRLQVEQNRKDIEALMR
jgi:hypothetical protein